MSETSAPDLAARSRRNVALAIAHAAIAVLILAAFFWAQAHR